MGLSLRVEGVPVLLGGVAQSNQLQRWGEETRREVAEALDKVGEKERNVGVECYWWSSDCCRQREVEISSYKWVVGEGRVPGGGLLIWRIGLIVLISETEYLPRIDKLFVGRGGGDGRTAARKTDGNLFIEEFGEMTRGSTRNLYNTSNNNKHLFVYSRKKKKKLSNDPNVETSPYDTLISSQVQAGEPADPKPCLLPTTTGCIRIPNETRQAE